MDGSYEFDVVLKDDRIDNVVLHMGGMHNVENVVAAIAVAHELGIDKEKIKAAVEAFRGVKRRFEYVIKNRALVFIDDYAHHPEELKALISGARSLFGGRKCTVIFQPHLFTRTRDLADEFAASLDLADEVILLPVYPARELPIAGVSSDMILERMTKENKRVMSKAALLQYMKEQWAPGINKEFGELLVTAGAGDIDALVGPVKEIVNGN
jgi:UDP-N-acetylmuramate--alanine ligase